MTLKRQLRKALEPFPGMLAEFDRMSELDQDALVRELSFDFGITPEEQELIELGKASQEEGDET